MRVHKLKTLAPYWDRVCTGDKTFEIRKNDRDFQVGDLLELERVETIPQPINPIWNPAVITARIKYVLCGGQFGLENGYCIMSIEIEK